MRIIGLDIGTTKICGIVCDTASGKVLKTASRKNDSFIKTPYPYEKIQDAEKIIANTVDIYNELYSAFGAQAVGITGQMHGIVYIDKSGKPVSPLYIWQDGRGDIDYNGDTYAEYISRLSGCHIASGYGAATHFYNLTNDKIPENAAQFCTIHDLAVMALTGRKTPLTHPTDAASIGLYDEKIKDFSKEKLDICGLDFQMFPSVCGELTVAGKTKDGIPVAAAIGDNQASVLGAAGKREDAAVINVGTGGQVSVIGKSEYLPDGIEQRPYFFKKNIVVGSSLCGGRAYALLENFIRDTVYRVTGQTPKNVYDVMDRLTSDCDTEDRLMVDTSFDGTRDCPLHRGSISNIGVNNFDLRSLCIGFIDGMANEIYGLYEKMRPCLENEPKIFIGTGNGIRENAALLKKLSEKFKAELKVPINREEAALGAAIYAAYACNINDIQNITTFEE